MSSSVRFSIRHTNRNLMFIRNYASPAPPKIQLKPAYGEKGFLAYTRNWSRDPKLARKERAPPQMGDLPFTFFTRRLGHTYEYYPFFFLVSVWACLCAFTVICTFRKAEVWLDKSTRTAPEDWERIHDSYWKKPTLLGDFEGKTRKRLDLMEMLEDEMLEAAKKRGTRE